MRLKMFPYTTEGQFLTVKPIVDSPARTDQGWNITHRPINRVTDFFRQLLNFDGGPVGEHFHMVAMKHMAGFIQIAPAVVIEEELTPFIRSKEDEIVIGFGIHSDPMIAK